jgi:hypothetical protein
MVHPSTSHFSNADVALVYGEPKTKGNGLGLACYKPAFCSLVTHLFPSLMTPAYI